MTKELIVDIMAISPVRKDVSNARMKALIKGGFDVHTGRFEIESRASSKSRFGVPLSQVPAATAYLAILGFRIATRPSSISRGYQGLVNTVKV
jgi:hypothetical protein